MLAFPDDACIMPGMKTDYGILRVRTAELIVSAALLLEDIGVSFVNPWNPDLDDLELRLVRIQEAYRRLDQEFDRLIDESITRERNTRRTSEHPHGLG